MNPRTAPDLAIVGASIRTLDPSRPAATAVAVRDGHVVAVGDDAEVRAACGPRTEILDGSGLAIVPGLTDSHLHPMWATEFAVGVDASRFALRSELAAALRAERERVGPDAVVRAWSVDYAHFAGPDMDGAVLEELAGGPALAVFFDLHTYLATPSVLAMAGVTGAEPFPDASEIVVRGGRPTGELREFSAFFRVADALPGATEEARLRRVAEVLRELNAAGLTGAHVMDGSPETFGLLRTLEERGDLTMRLVVPLWVKPEHDDAAQEAYLRHRDEHGRLWRGGAAKFFADGVIDSGTAWLEEPDTRGDGNDPFWPDPSRYDAAVARFAGAGFQCITHAVGDRAVRAALDAYRDAGRRPLHGMHRIEHIEALGPETLARFAAEGVAASMQPLHMKWRQADGGDEWAVRLGRARTAQAFPAGDMLRGGATVALGSDWPVAPYDPRYGMAWARLRRHPGRRDDTPFEAEQRLTALQALEGYTQGAAAVVGEQAASGRIAPGMRADLTAFAADPVDTPADELADLPVLMTVVDGRVVHREG